MPGRHTAPGHWPLKYFGFCLDQSRNRKASWNSDGEELGSRDSSSGNDSFFFALFELPGSPANIRWGNPDGLNKSHKRDMTFRGPNHVGGNPHLNTLGRRPRNPTLVLGGDIELPMSPSCNQKLSLEWKIPSWQLPVTFEFELKPGLEPL